VSRDVAIPAPPFWGARTTPSREIPFAGMFSGMDLKTLYRLHWGARGTGEVFDRASLNAERPAASCNPAAFRCAMPS
jgi:hypothetical protein